MNIIQKRGKNKKREITLKVFIYYSSMLRVIIWQEGGNKMKTLDYIALILVIIGAINWGLIGFFSFDLVRAIFGDMTLVSRIIYALVGISGLYSLSFFGRLENE